MNDAISHLNNLAAESAASSVPMRTTQELRDFFKNPPRREYSVALEDAITSVVRMFGTADENRRGEIVSQLSSPARNSFLGYASSMAVLAVRGQSPTLIEQGLIALVIEGASQDFRDSVKALAMLYHSATKLGMDPQKAFYKAASLAEPGIIKKEMNGFPLRQAKDRELKAFSLTEEIAEEGFRYKQLPWSLPQSTPQAVPTRPVETPQQISTRLNRDQQNALIGMAGTLAAMAIRTQSPKLVEQGLQGLALGGGALSLSHSLSDLAKLYHSAIKLGMKAEVTFAAAAQLAPPGELKTEMARFPLRDPKDRDLAAFNLQEEITEKGFDYKEVPTKK